MSRSTTPIVARLVRLVPRPVPSVARSGNRSRTSVPNVARSFQAQAIWMPIVATLARTAMRSVPTVGQSSGNGAPMVPRSGPREPTAPPCCACRGTRCLADEPVAVWSRHRLLASERRSLGGRAIDAGFAASRQACRAPLSLDRERAAEVAALAGESLVSLKLEAPPAPAASSPAAASTRAPGAAPALAPAPTRALPKPEDLVDVLVLAGIVETGGSAVEVRRWLHAVMKRACDVGLSVEEAERALRPAAP